MNNTKLHLCRAKDPEFATYLQLHYDNDDGSRTYEDILFMDQYQMLDYVMENLDLGTDLYGGVCDGEELSITTNVCYLPDAGNIYVTMDDYYLLQEHDQLAKAAELVSSCKR